MNHFDIVIIGNSAAGLSAVKTIRKLSSTAGIALIDREDCPAYSRVLTPYYIGGKTSRENLFIEEPSFYRLNGIHTFFGRTAVGIDPDDRTVVLDDGTGIGYTSLLIATGGEATKPPIVSDKVLRLRHMSDADALHRKFVNARCVAGFGAG